MAKKQERMRVLDGVPTYKLDASQMLAHDELHRFAGADPANSFMYDPTESQVIPKVGSWIMINRKLPPLEGDLDKLVNVGDIFYAFHHEDADAHGFRPTGLYNVFINVAKTQPHRELTLWPYEYSKIAVEDVLASWQDQELVFYPKAVDLATMNAVVFYARSRGIALADAVVMALGSITSDVGWFEPVPELAQAMAEMEERVHRWRPRREYASLSTENS